MASVARESRDGERFDQPVAGVVWPARRSVTWPLTEISACRARASSGRHPSSGRRSPTGPTKRCHDGLACEPSARGRPPGVLESAQPPGARV